MTPECYRCETDTHVCQGCGQAITHDYKAPDGSEHRCPYGDSVALKTWWQFA